MADLAERFQCAARGCHATILWYGRRDHTGALVPSIATTMATNGWTRIGTVPAGRRFVALGGGEGATVALADREVDLGQWCCSQGCANRLAVTRTSGKEKHSFDGGDPRDRARMVGARPADAPRPQGVVECRAHCGTRLPISTLPAEPKRAAYLAALGWIEGFCSGRCMTIAGGHRPKPAPTTALGRAEYQQRTGHRVPSHAEAVYKQVHGHALGEEPKAKRAR